MTIDEIKDKQIAEREECCQAISNSSARKKLIVAGPGTGKTHAFRGILSKNPSVNNIALTFIRRLAEDMDCELGNCAETKTFHAYCKKVLHQQNGRVELVPYLSQVIRTDSILLGEPLDDFDVKFQTLDEGSDEIEFYLRRGDYYEIVSFNDSVYRLYKLLQTKPDIVPAFTQIVVDEFQDFNPLEVAFLTELEKKGPILIVGDDDQAVYDDRSSSPIYLRDKYNSGEFAIFDLPFCSRCSQVIVDATNAFVTKAQSLGHLSGRIDKRFECYLPDKELDSNNYPKIITAQLKVLSAIPKYILKEIERIDKPDIEESRAQEREYPTILIVGPRQYLRETEKQLKKVYPHIAYSFSEDLGYSVVNGYELLLRDQKSNLGWRILAEFFCQEDELKKIIDTTETAVPMVDILNVSFTEKHSKAIEILTDIKKGMDLTPELADELRAIVGDSSFDEVVACFTPTEESEEVEIDRTQPTILLTSYKGCKGLSAGHVFIIGANNGSMPKDPKNTTDVEISQLIVALTRTRKQCHIISNMWFDSPKDRKGNWIPSFEKSDFISWISIELIEDRGTLSAEDIKKM